jgi:hypothetical protein
MIIACFGFSIAQSQEITDAVRYTEENLIGTARFRGMSGAFGALGGDLSSININPAGSVVFNNNQVATTFSNYGTKNNSNYFGKNETTNDNSFDLNQAGGVFVFKDANPDGNWKKISFEINYENANKFNNSIFSSGTNPNNSVSNYFLHYANGVPLTDLQNSTYGQLGHGAQQAFLGYQAYIINPVNASNANNTQYFSNVPAGGNYYQENNMVSIGNNGKLSFNAATSYKDKLFLGINLNSHFTDFRQTTSFYEDNNAPLTSNYEVSRLQFDNELYTHGTGFSFQIGAIAKVTNGLRLGLAYQSPIWFNMSDELTQKISAVSASTSGELAPDIVNPRLTNFYDPYKLQTPSKVTGSFAYVFGKSGLISVDYAMKDYSKTKFMPTNDAYFIGINNTMGNLLNSTAELRIGGEIKIKEWSFRGGYRSEESPYKDKNTIGDLTGYSGGLGYNFGATKLDLAYSHAHRNSQQGFFSQGLTDPANINTKNNTVSLTLLFEL